MNRFLNLSTRTKLLSAFGVMTLFSVAAIVFAYNALETVRASQQALLQVEMANVTDLKDIRTDHHGVRASVALMMISTDAAQLDLLREDVEARSRRMQDELARVTARRDEGDDADLLRAFDATQSASVRARETQILPLIAQGKLAEARALFTGAQLERDQRLAAMVDQLLDNSRRRAEEVVAQTGREADAALRRLLALAALALATGLLLTLLLTRALAHPLRALSEAAQKLAAGDLTVAVAQESRTDEAGVLTRTFAQMAERLRGMMRELGEGVTVLASSASEITASTAQVAASSSQTASAVAETSATAEEVKQTARLTSDKAAEVQDAAQRTVEASQTGLRSMNECIEAMHQVREQMDSLAQSILRLAEQGVAIGDIIATVNDLADQSNLLSVNAAIEAARAGEEGAGFRVVAQEIRSLAQQSKQATVQVRSLLGEIQKATGSAVMTAEQATKAVRSGVALSEATAGAIRSMQAAVEESAVAATQIAVSAQQQAVGMDQVSYAMQNISQATAQNVAASRQTEAAAHGVQDLGHRLKGVVEQYRT